MASIRRRMTKEGESTSFTVDIRKKNISITRTFYTEEDAKLFEFYKERLIQNMENFNVPLKDRVTLRNLFELKILTIDDSNKRMRDELNCTLERLEKIFGADKYVNEINYDQWLDAAKTLYATPVFIGFDKESNRRQMSVNTLKRIIASASSVMSYALTKGIDVENHPIKIIQKYVNNLINSNNKDLHE